MLNSITITITHIEGEGQSFEIRCELSPFRAKHINNIKIIEYKIMKTKIIMRVYLYVQCCMKYYGPVIM